MKPFYKSRMFWSGLIVSISGAAGILISRGDTIGLGENVITYLMIAQIILGQVIVGLRIQDEKQAKERNAQQN